jgi:hypothetical protein
MAAAPALIEALKAMAASLHQQMSAPALPKDDGFREAWTVPGDLRELPRPVSAQAQQALQALVKLLEDDDSQAMVMWQQERGVFKHNLPPLTFTRLNTAMDRCDFESALRLLKEGIEHADA